MAQPKQQSDLADAFARGIPLDAILRLLADRVEELAARIVALEQQKGGRR
jgi:hypothetical protein